jgi:hypothetical protein
LDSLFDRQNSGKNAIDKNSHDFTNDDFNKNSTYSKTFSIDFEEPTPHFEEPAHEVNRALSSESEGPTLILDQPAFSSASKGRLIIFVEIFSENCVSATTVFLIFISVHSLGII